MTAPGRLAASGPRGFVGLLGGVALVVGLCGLLLLLDGSAAGPRPETNEAALWVLRTLCVLGVAGLLASLSLPRLKRPAAAAVPREPAARDLLSAAILAAALVLPALLLPVHYLAARTHPTTLVWNRFGFLDKRWITSLYVIATTGVALALACASRAIAVALAQPVSWRAWAAGLLPRSTDAPGRSPPPRAWPRTLLALGCAMVVGAYFFGPPWHLPAVRIGYHEALTLGGVQAVRTGSLPYIDSAAVQYGPGAQILNVAYAGLIGPLSVDGFRDAELLLHWIAATLFLGALFLRVRPLVAAVAAFVAITMFPTLQTFAADSSGAIPGYYWGWTDTLRYAGVFVVAMAFPALVARASAAPIRMRAVALGAGWGLLCLIAQENLIGGALAIAVLSVLFAATATYGRRELGTTIAWIAAGWALVAMPTVGYYAAHGKLGRFIDLYTLVPRAVASGYSNTPFPSSSLGRLYSGLPYLLGGLLLLALLTARPWRVAVGWTQRRVVLVSALVAAIVCHLGALTRSDNPHLINTQLALPAALTLAAFELPALLGARSRSWRWGGGLAIAGVALALLPLSTQTSKPTLLAQKLWWPLHARISPPAQRPLPAGIPAGSEAAARIGDATIREPRCCGNSPLRMAPFVRFMDRLHMTVGGRRVLVDAAGVLTPPAVYFLADLRPAPFEQDYGTLVLDNRMRPSWLRFLRHHLDQTQAVVTTNRGDAVSRIWSAAFPHHETVTLGVGGRPVYVLRR